MAYLLRGRQQLYLRASSVAVQFTQGRIYMTINNTTAERSVECTETTYKQRKSWTSRRVPVYTKLTEISERKRAGLHTDTCPVSFLQLLNMSAVAIRGTRVDKDSTENRGTSKAALATRRGLVAKKAPLAVRNRRGYRPPLQSIGYSTTRRPQPPRPPTAAVLDRRQRQSIGYSTTRRPQPPRLPTAAVLNRRQRQSIGYSTTRRPQPPRLSTAAVLDRRQRQSIGYSTTRRPQPPRLPTAAVLDLRQRQSIGYSTTRRPQPPRLPTAAVLDLRQRQSIGYSTTRRPQPPRLPTAAVLDRMQRQSIGYSTTRRPQPPLCWTVGKDNL
ncbi:hypothetical protein J6590_021572 [Homalodisca vitripennis]|nr:hypothetical protein J6590_021572 [Homalodisca vitripennis]